MRKLGMVSGETKVCIEGATPDTLSERFRQYKVAGEGAIRHETQVANSSQVTSTSDCATGANLVNP